MTASIASLRVSAQCNQCQTYLVYPEWSEPLGPGKSVHLWHCLFCGNDFETIDDKPSQTMSDQEVVEELLPELLVA